jgi:hypothetical protein
MGVAIIEYAGMALGYGIVATRAFHTFVVPFALVTAVAGAASLLLIPSHGLLGAAWALVVIRIAGCAGQLTILRGTKAP